MRNIFQNLYRGDKRGWAASVIGVVASVVIATSALFPIQAQAEDGDGPYVILIGAPGSGKSTVGAHISKATGVPVIEVGQLLRDEVAAASEYTGYGKPGGKRWIAEQKRLRNIEAAKEQIEAGELVDSQAVDAAVAAGVLAPSAANGFILDGYPGSVTQAAFLDAILAARSVAPIVIYLDVTDDVALARMKSRGRIDDKSGFAQKRLEVFRLNTAPLLAFYADAGLNTVDANMELGDVLGQVDKILTSE